MTLLDLSLVSSSLQRLVEGYVRGALQTTPEQDLAGPPAEEVKVQTVAPDDLSGNYTVGLHLYHVAENGHASGAPFPSSAGARIRHGPIALDLYYQLTTHSDLTEADTATRWRQLLMGLAVKGLHDHPVIDDDTTLHGRDGTAIRVLHEDLRGRGNRFQVALQPVPYDQAVSFWSAGSSPVRLSAYYQVSLVLLEPEEPQSTEEPVIDYRVQTVLGEGPHLAGSRNTVRLRLPGDTGQREVTARPARVPIGGEVVFTGNGLASDDSHLLLSTERWQQPRRVDPEWPVRIDGSTATTTVQPTLGTAPIVPGVYRARVQVTRPGTEADGSAGVDGGISNETPFTIAPRIDGISGPDADGVVAVQAYLLEDSRPDTPDVDVEVFAGGQRLQRVAGDAGPGEFRIDDPERLRLRLPPDMEAAGTPLRVRVDGAESLPHWMAQSGDGSNTVAGQ